MNSTRISDELLRRFEAFAGSVDRPSSCPGCAASVRVWWNGFRVRAASFWFAGCVVYVPRLRIRLAKCSSCRVSWSLYPPGLIPHRHYQPSLVFEAVGRWLLEGGASEEEVARRADCSRRTVGRWLRWLRSVAKPADLVRSLLEVTDEVVLPFVARIAERRSAAGSSSRGVILEQVAEILASLAGLAAAVGHRIEILPEFARRHRALLWGMLPM